VGVFFLLFFLRVATVIETHGAATTREDYLQSDDFLDGHPVFKNQKIHKIPRGHIAPRDFAIKL
jgi:hypothetical protein